MKRRFTRTLCLSLLVMALIAVSAAPAAAGGGNGNGRQVERPYKDRVVSSSGPGTDCTTFEVIRTDPIIVECPYGPMVNERRTTHLGRNTNTLRGVTRSQFPPVACVDYLGRPGIVSTTIYDAVAVAANGSKLFTHGHWTACFQDGVGGNGSGMVTFTGGTGRFEGASGSSSFEWFVPGGDEPNVSTSVGTIIY
ncbi:MAG: hypothetical protein ACR2N9_04730 [Acidimicrobiia bacterium]